MENTSFDMLDLVSLRRWQEGDGDNSPRMERLQRNLSLALEELTPVQRQAVEMYYFRRMTQTEIARELGLNKSSISRALTRAKRRMRGLLRYSL